MTLWENNLSPYATFVEGTTPASPAAGQQRLFFDSADHKVKRVNSSGTVTTVEGGGGGTDPLTTKGDIWVYSSTDARQAVGSNGQLLLSDSSQTTGLKWANGYLGGRELVYKYAVTGASKASIDTGVDTAAAGSTDWTNGEVLEIFFLGQSDNAAAAVNVDLTFNNDTATNYDWRFLQSATSVTAGGTTTDTKIKWQIHGSGGTASFASSLRASIVGYAGTTFYKSGEAWISQPDDTTGNLALTGYAFGWKSTSAITRVAITSESTDKLKIGSTLLIYKNRST